LTTAAGVDHVVVRGRAYLDVADQLDPLALVRLAAATAMIAIGRCRQSATYLALNADVGPTTTQSLLAQPSL
jgi:hypothetical protein